jgi:hypothetical protein
MELSLNLDSPLVMTRVINEDDKSVKSQFNDVKLFKVRNGTQCYQMKVIKIYFPYRELNPGLPGESRVS